jgi:CBS domain-containing protein
VLVSDVMTAFPAYIRLGATIRWAAEMVSVSEVGHLMVLDHDGRFVGSLSEEDVVRAMLPGFGDVTAAGGTLADAFRIFLRQLVADGRLGEDVFTTYLGHAQEGRRFEVSELATHNAPGAPYWMAIGGAVFDVSEFQHLTSAGRTSSATTSGSTRQPRTGRSCTTRTPKSTPSSPCMRSGICAGLTSATDGARPAQPVAAHRRIL